MCGMTSLVSCVMVCVLDDLCVGWLGVLCGGGGVCVG